MPERDGLHLATGWSVPQATAAPAAPARPVGAHGDGAW